MRSINFMPQHNVLKIHMPGRPQSNLDIAGT